MDSTHRNSPFGRLPERQLPFTTRLSRLEDIPPTFRKTVSRLLDGRENKVQHILFTPEFGTFGEYCPASIFIVTDDEWLAMSAEKTSAPSVRYADFTQTRLVEFSLELLSGRLVLESGEAGEAACVLRFNLTSRDLFQDALASMLGLGEKSATVGPSELAGFSALSIGMRSSLCEAVMPGDKCIALAAWARTDVASASDRLAVQPGGLLLTERYLCVFLSDDHAERSSSGDMSAYSRGVVYLSRQFAIIGRSVAQGEIDALTLSVGEGTQSSVLTVYLPHSAKPQVDGVLGVLSANH